MVRSLPLRALAILLAVGALASACGDDRRPAGGFRVIDRNADARTNADATEGPEREDAGFAFDAGRGEGWPDAEAPWDGGFEVPDVGWPDATNPDLPDTGPRDSGVHRDASVPDTGPRDSGFVDSGVPFPFPDAGSSSGDAGPAVQTNVTIDTTQSSLVLDVRAGGPADPLTYSTVLQYDNAGPGSQTISITSAAASLVIVTQGFQMGPAHLAPVGASTQVVSKIAGTQDTDISAYASLACGFPIPVAVTLTLSNGLVLTDLVTPTCRQ